MFVRSFVALMLGVGASACGASGDAFSLPDETPRDAGAEGGSAADEADAAPGSDSTAAPTDLDAACNACIDASLSWGEDGELWDETSTLRACHAYTHTREAFGARASASCADEGPTIYGRDSRLVDGRVFRMVINGKEIVLGACAAEDEQCIPPGVASLANLLRSVDDELLRRPACAEALASD